MYILCSNINVTQTPCHIILHPPLYLNIQHTSEGICQQLIKLKCQGNGSPTKVPSKGYYCLQGTISKMAILPATATFREFLSMFHCGNQHKPLHW